MHAFELTILIETRFLTKPSHSFRLQAKVGKSCSMFEAMQSLYVLPALRYKVLCAHRGLLGQGSTSRPNERIQFDCPQRFRSSSQGALVVEIACNVDDTIGL